MLCLTNAVLFGGLAYLFLDPILFFFGASTGTLPYARDFMQVILLGTPITYTMIGLNNVMRATGYPRKAMLTSLVTVIANVIIALSSFSISVGEFGSCHGHSPVTVYRNDMGSKPLP